jgi:hypothetical protein
MSCRSSGLWLSRQYFSLASVMRNAAHLAKWAALQTRQGLDRTGQTGHVDLRPLNVIGACPDLAPAASSPRQATAATATSAASPAATSAASAAATASAATATSAAAAASPGDLYAALACAGVLLVKNIERRQADVRDFLFTEGDFVPLRGVLQRRHIRDRPTGRCGCAPR